HNPGHVIDFVPTFLEVAGSDPVANPAGRNNAIPPRPGKSLVPAFARDGTVSHDCLWWEHEGNRAVRAGDWKLVAAGRGARWELYDLTTDRTETRNLAAQRAAKVWELDQLWQKRHDEFTALAREDHNGAQPGAKAGPVK